MEKTPFEIDAATLEDVHKFINLPVAARETHPQARKYAQALSQLDTAWLQAIKRVQYSKKKSWPTVSVVLGALPPSFSVVYKTVMTSLRSLDTELGELDVLQFYGLATGRLPVPSRWQSVLPNLESLSHEELALLKSLSYKQFGQLKTLSKETLFLLVIIRSVRQATPQWRDIISALSDLSTAELRASGLVSKWRHNYRITIGQLETLHKLVQTPDWHSVRSLDEELIRIIDRGALSLDLCLRLQAWTEEDWQHIRLLLQTDWLWLSSYLEDKRMLATYLGVRTPARLELAELFPKTTAYLDDLILANMNAILIRGLDTVTEYAAQFSELLEQTLFEGN